MTDKLSSYIADDIEPYVLAETLNMMMQELNVGVKFSTEEKYIRNQFDVPRVGMKVGDVLAKDYVLMVEKV